MSSISTCFQPLAPRRWPVLARPKSVPGMQTSQRIIPPRHRRHIDCCLPLCEPPLPTASSRLLPARWKALGQRMPLRGPLPASTRSNCFQGRCPTSSNRCSNCDVVPASSRRNSRTSKNGHRSQTQCDPHCPEPHVWHGWQTDFEVAEDLGVSTDDFRTSTGHEGTDPTSLFIRGHRKTDGRAGIALPR